MSLKVAEGIVKTLEKLGTQVIFGIPGSQTSPFYDALYSSSIRHVLVRHEQMAAYMADAYAKFTGKPGICDGTGGPGATNLLTGVATSWTDSIPILAFTGQQPLSQVGKGAFQELDHVSIFKPVTKWSTQLVRAERAVEIAKEAYRIATWGKPGPVHINLPLDVQVQNLTGHEEQLLEKWPFDLSPPRSIGDPHTIKEAMKLLISSSRPLIISGGGVHYSGRAWKPLRALAELLEIPVATTFNGRGSFPEDHPLSAGRMGLHAASYNDEVLARADVILAVGCRFASMSTRRWRNINPKAVLIHVDIDPENIGRNYPAEISIVGDARKVLEKMLEEAERMKTENQRRREWLEFLNSAKERWRESRWFIESRPEDSSLKPQRVCMEIRRLLNRDTVFTLDAGNNKLWASTFLEIYEPCTWIQSGCFGPMGYALPAAIACKLASPSRTVVALCGDGGFYMSLHELSTSIQEIAPVIVCILNDRALGTIKHRQRDSYGGRFISVDFKNLDFASVAEAFGCIGLEAKTLSQFRSALKEGIREFKRGNTVVINVYIDGDEPLPP
ncbi:TPA: thiamine pyrophosphate-binding protein [Candidatus Bathyarchaeota archaeon]|nr:thiamine pyrophosphate-binding protein [Candidatus Bathyarchaeota archaeon]